MKNYVWDECIIGAIVTLQSDTLRIRATYKYKNVFPHICLFCNFTLYNLSLHKIYA